MYLINLRATYKNMDFSTLEKWTSMTDEMVVELFSSTFSEMVILRTCNRFEIYLVPRNGKESTINEIISRLGKIDVDYDKNAIQHLVEVAAGMDSMIPGEQDIQRQVKDALKSSMEKGLSGKLLNYIFMRALNISKDVRSQTRIGNGIVSIPQSAVRILEDILHEGNIGIIGTGRVANSLIKYMEKKYSITVFGRNEEKLQIIGEKHNVKTSLLKNLTDEINNLDGIISAVSVSEPILRSENFRGRKPYMVIDLGNPRNIERLSDRYYVDLEYIKGYVEKNITLRKREMERARIIINEKLERIEEKITGLEIENIISGMFKRARSIRDEEVDEAVKILGESARETLEKYGDSMIKKIYSTTIKRLRSEGKDLTRDEIELLKKILG